MTQMTEEKEKTDFRSESNLPLPMGKILPHTETCRFESAIAHKGAETL